MKAGLDELSAEAPALVRGPECALPAKRVSARNPDWRPLVEPQGLGPVRDTSPISEPPARALDMKTLSATMSAMESMPSALTEASSVSPHLP